MGFKNIYLLNYAQKKTKVEEKNYLFIYLLF